ncbi:hypothetical protein ESA94_02035 [Lacibacter luteus]|uniref:DUF4846 domain-containing protein n=1 Tax=Lacibacter luteus TaxID=2508719 RepID=A0A4Q1CLE9_9BACT|nr:DUF4846 domain-containing protein [Lacibacter luteus]RXK61816.1 hypothetical protein ESA94_02035 [Lacibacter luteus]
MNPVAFFFTCVGIFPFSISNTRVTPAAPKTIYEIPLPDGYERKQVQENSFAKYLQQLSLKNDRTVYLYNGKPKTNQSAQYAVLNISVGNKDLQQCADAVMRLRAEYLKKQNKPICFADNNSKKYCWDDYRHRGWQTYLDVVFGMCGTASLEKQLNKKSWKALAAGDVLIKGGSPGHAVIVLDVACHSSTGEIIYLLAQSYMPAQDIHVLKNTNNKSLSPWYSASSVNIISTPEWTFYESQLRSWP